MYPSMSYTGFNVSAYKEDRELAVTLAHGSVKVSGTPGNVVLKPDERFVLEKQSHSYQVEQVNARQICAWKEGKPCISNQCLWRI